MKKRFTRFDDVEYRRFPFGIHERRERGKRSVTTNEILRRLLLTELSDQSVKYSIEMKLTKALKHRGGMVRRSFDRLIFGNELLDANMWGKNVVLELIIA